MALFVDRHPQVLWWYGNLVGEGSFSIQGHRRNPIYPDFVVQKGDLSKNLPIPKVLVVESKGKHLKGNEDTNYKRDIGMMFQEVGQRVTWQELGAGFQDETFRFQVLDEGEYTDKDWHGDLQKFLESEWQRFPGLPAGPGRTVLRYQRQSAVKNLRSLEVGPLCCCGLGRLC